MSDVIRSLLLVCLCAALAGAQDLSTLDVPLTVHDTAGVARVAEPCSTGVPLPQGLLEKPEGITVFNKDGKAIPAQFKVLERWREFGSDESIKWLLVTLLADVPAGQKVVYRLKNGENPAPERPVKIEEKGDAFEMGGLSFKKDLSAPFAPVLITPDGKRVPASQLKTLKWSVWEPGPVRACLAVESRTENGKYGVMAWIYAYAGETPRWDMTVVLKNTPNKARGPMYFKDFSVEWKPRELAGAKSFLLGGEWGKVAEGDGPAYLYQDSDGTDSWATLSRRLRDWRTGKYRASNAWANGYCLTYAKYMKDGKKTPISPLGKPEFRGYKVFNDGKEAAAGNFAQGWAGLNGNGKSGVLLVRDFLRQYPKAVEVGPGTLTARLWPKYWKAHGGNHWLDDLQRKAHDLSFRLIEGKLTGAAGESAAKAFDRPSVIACGGDWYRKTGAYGHLSRRFKHGTVKAGSKLISTGSTWVTYGGDLSDRIRRRYHQRPMGSFLRGGNPGSALGVRVAMRHSVGVTPMWPDDYQYPRDAKMLKIGYCSPARRSGGRYRSGTAHHGYMPWNNQHWLCDEIPDAWRLFGDPLAYDAMKDMATYIRFYFDRRNSGKEGIGETRVDALPMVVIADCYRILGDEAILKALSKFVRTACWRQVNKQRGYYKPNRNVDRAAGGSDKPFMLSTLMDGLRQYWNLTQDEAALDLMLGITDFCIDEAFINDKMGFRYTIPVDLKKSRRTLAAARAAKVNRGGYRGWQMFRPLAFAYLQTGEEAYRDVFLKMCKAAKDATVWRHRGSPNPDSSDWGYICDQVRDMPNQTKSDATPPAAVNDLKAEPLGGGKVKLTWTTPADAALLQIKHAAKPMVKRVNLPGQKDTHANWWAASQVTGEPEPKAGAQSMVVEGVPVGMRVFAIRSFDAHSNRSGLSNMARVEVK